MFHFIVYDKTTGKIVSSGDCSSQKDIKLQGTDVMEGKADAISQKIINLGQYGIKPVGFLRVVNKTPEEIGAENPPKPKPIPIEKQPAHITNEQWQDVLDRLKKLETKNDDQCPSCPVYLSSRNSEESNHSQNRAIHKTE